MLTFLPSTDACRATHCPAHEHNQSALDKVLVLCVRCGSLRPKCELIRLRLQQLSTPCNWLRLNTARYCFCLHLLCQQCGIMVIIFSLPVPFLPLNLPFGGEPTRFYALLRHSRPTQLAFVVAKSIRVGCWIGIISCSCSFAQCSTSALQAALESCAEHSGVIT